MSVSRKASAILRFWDRVEKTKSCWNFKGASIRGYRQLHVNGRATYAHRYSYEIHNGPIPEGHEVMHICDNPGCVNPSHLRIGTERQNMEDMCLKGRTAAKLCFEDVRRIRDLVVMGVPQSEIAKHFGVSCTSVSNVVTGNSFGYVS